MRRRLILVGILASLLMISLQPTTYAQDDGGEEGITEYEQLLLDRFMDALQTPTTYVNYVKTGTVKDLQELRYDLSGQPATISTGTQTQYETTVVNSEDGENTQSIISLQFQDSAPGETIAYSLSAEIRHVDNELYVMATYDEVSDTLPLLPESWVWVEDAALYPELAEINLNDYRDIEYLFDDRELLAQSLTAISLESQVISGVDVQTISVAFRGEDFIPIFKALQPADAPANTGTPLFDMIFANLTDTTEIVMSVAIDAENNPLIFASNINLETTPLDMSLLDAENFTSTDMLVVRLLVQREDTLFSFNTGGLEPVPAPIE